LYCFIAGNEGDSPTPAQTYQDGEILEGLYAEAVVWPTRARCSGTGFANEALDAVAGGLAGREIVNFITDASMNSAAWCLVVAQSAIDDGEARGQAGYIVTRPNVGLELYDIVEVSDSYVGAAGLSSVLRRVNQIRTVYDPLDERWEQRVGLEHV